MPTSQVDDRPPTAVADAITLSANQAAADTQVTTTYVDADGVTQTVVQDVYGATIDVLRNDTDPDPGDAGKVWIFDVSQPLDAQGRAAGALTVEKDAGGHDVLRFYDPDPSLQTGVHTVTFTYRAADQWAVKGDPATWPTAVSQPTTVTITITGNTVPAETLTAPAWGGHGQPIAGKAGNDLLLGSEGRDVLVGGGGADTLVGAEGSDSLSGGDGNDRLYGGGHVYDGFERWLLHTQALYSGGDGWFDLDGGCDTLNGGAGDDTMTGGGPFDRFVFDYGFGHDVVTDFHPLTDKIVVDHNMWPSFADLTAHAAQLGKDVVLTSDFGGYTITLQHVKLASLFAGDFVFT